MAKGEQTLAPCTERQPSLAVTTQVCTVEPAREREHSSAEQHTMYALWLWQGCGRMRGTVVIGALGNAPCVCCLFLSQVCTVEPGSGERTC